MNQVAKTFQKLSICWHWGEAWPAEPLPFIPSTPRLPSSLLWQRALPLVPGKCPAGAASGRLPGREGVWRSLGVAPGEGLYGVSTRRPGQAGKQAGYPRAGIISAVLAHRGCVYLSSPCSWVIRAGGWCLPECADHRGMACSVGSDWSVCK